MSLDIYLYAEVDTGGAEPYRAELATQNITHNVTPMWRLVGVYEALYESNGHVAGDTLPVLRDGVSKMRAQIDACRALNPPNGWGNADEALKWLERWLAACEAHPKATIRVSR